jgi:hypothetical protein
MKRTLTDYSNDELKRALEQNETGEHTIQEYSSDVPEFLSFYKIKPGKDLVLKRVLYKLYGYWSENSLDKEKFNSQVNEYIPTRQVGPYMYYVINQKALDLSKHAYDHIIEHTHDRTKIPAWKAHFDKYLEYYKLKPGTFFIESYILHNLYDKYTYETKKKMPMGYKQFVNFCRLYFDAERLTSNKVCYFGVDKSIREFITDDEIKQLRKSRKLNGKKAKQKV